MVAYTKPQQKKKEESKGLRGERGQVKFIDLRFERWQVVRFRKARRKILNMLNTLFVEFKFRSSRIPYEVDFRLQLTFESKFNLGLVQFKSLINVI